MSSTLPNLEYAHAWLVDLASTPSLPDGNPAFLFRGERSEYSHTLSSLDRHCQQLGLESQTYDQLEKVAQYVLEESCTLWDLPPRVGAAFCQHYGLPTWMFDFTCHPDVAVFFSSNRVQHESKAKRGRIGILDVAQALANHCAIFDLRLFKPAKRPRAQSGFGFMRAHFKHDDILDLKEPNIAAEIGLSWLEFEHLPDDETYLYVIGAESDLMSLEGDKAAQIPQDLVDQYVREKGPLSCEAAAILAEEIPAIGRTQAENCNVWLGGVNGAAAGSQQHVADGLRDGADAGH
jgi:hypothetical protein